MAAANSRKSVAPKGTMPLDNSSMLHQESMSRKSVVAPGRKRQSQQGGENDAQTRQEQFREYIARLDTTVKSVYKPSELRAVEAVADGRTPEEEPWEYDSDESDYDRDMDLDPNAPIGAFASRRRPPGLEGVLTVGKARVVQLLEGLNTQKRVAVLESLSRWFDEKAPSAQQKGMELSEIEAKHARQEKMFELRKDETTKMLEADCLASFEHLRDFHQSLTDKIGGSESLQWVEKQHTIALQEFQKATQEHVVGMDLEEALETVRELKEQLEELGCAPDGTDISDNEEQTRLNELGDSLELRREKLTELEAMSAYKSAWSGELWQLLQKIKRDANSPDGFKEPTAGDVRSVITAIKQKIRDERMEEVRISCVGIEDLQALAQAKVKEADLLEARAAEVNEEAKAQELILSIVGTDEDTGQKVFDSSLEEAGEEELKLRLFEVIQSIREIKKDLPNLQDNLDYSEATSRALTSAKDDVEKQMQRAVANLLQEECFACLDEVDASFEQEIPIDSWQQRLNEDWIIAEQDPGLFTRFLWPEHLDEPPALKRLPRGRSFARGSVKALASQVLPTGHDLDDGIRKLWGDLESLFEDELFCPRKVAVGAPSLFAPRADVASSDPWNHPSLKQLLAAEDAEEDHRMRMAEEENVHLVEEVERMQGEIKLLRDSILNPVPTSAGETQACIMSELRGVVSDLTDRVPFSRQPSKQSAAPSNANSRRNSLASAPQAPTASPVRHATTSPVK